MAVDGIYSLSAQKIEAQHDNVAHPIIQELHVVMVPYPLQGHINPMMQFAKLLAAKHGVRVTFVNSKHNHDRILQYMCSTSSSTAPSSPSPNVMQRHSSPQAATNLQFVWVDHDLPPGFDYTDLAARMREFRLATFSMKDPLKQLIQSLNQKSPPVSCVLFGSFCPWAHTVAEELGIPSVFFWTQSTCVCSIYHNIPLLAANNFFRYNQKSLPGYDEDEDEVKPRKTIFDKVSYIPGVPSLHPSSFPTLFHMDSSSKSSLAFVEEQFGILQNCAGIIVNSFEELEKDAYQALQATLPFPVSLVGPLIPAAFLDGRDMNDTSVGASLLQEKNDCIQWLDSQKNRSVLYVSFGSVFNPSDDDLQGIACGIRACKQPFLWVIRPRPSLQNVAAILPQGFIEDTEAYGQIIPWAPQMQVLSHPSVGAFLTHCGWNSTLESVSMGMPMIPFPLFSDQPTNCTFVCQVWKIGVALKRQDDGMVTSADVERAIRTVLNEQEGKEMRKRAGKLREAARLAVLPQGCSHMHIEKFIEAMRN